MSGAPGTAATAGRNGVAFFTDEVMLEGAQVALHSTLRTWLGPAPLAVFLFHAGLAARQVDGLRRILETVGKPFELEAVRFEVGRFGHLRSLHGNRLTYGRLCLAELLPGSTRVVYLDSDLVVGRDLSELFAMPLGPNGLAAAAPGPMNTSLDWEFYRDLAIAPSAPCLNSGVLAIDLETWRACRRGEELLDFAKRHSGRLRSADQTVLNGVFRGNFVLLPDPMNLHLYPSSEPPPDPEGVVAHFVGSPKPFDPFGRALHRSAPLFRFAQARIPRPLTKRGTRASLGRLIRALRLTRSYWRTWARRNQVPARRR